MFLRGNNLPKCIRLCTTTVKNIVETKNSSEVLGKLFESKSDESLREIRQSFTVIPDFVDSNEEGELLKEVEKVLKRIRYEQSHWDDAIHNYRETEHVKWNVNNSNIIERVRQVAFAQDAKHIKFVHILDVAKDGFIKPHVDSIRVS